MKTLTLKVQKRSVSGRHSKKLRREGTIPATVYGKKIKSFSISVNHQDFQEIYQKAGETSVVELNVDQDTHPVLIHNVQIHPVSDEILHIEFRQVDLKEAVKANIQILAKGIASAVEQKAGLLIQTLNELEVEALPGDLLDKIEVDISKLEAVDDEIRVKDLKISDKIKVLSDQEQGIFRIVAPAKEEEPVAPPTPAEGEAPPAEGEAAVETAKEQPGQAKGEPVQAEAKNPPAKETPKN